MRYKKVVVGGTFDPFHKGHKKFLEKAYEIGEKVLIGLTKDEMLEKDHNVFPYNVRKLNLEKYLEQKNVLERTKIEGITDPYGPAIEDESLQAIVVTSETEKTAQEINKLRNQREMPPLDIIRIPFVKAENGKPLTATRIRKGEIDREGRKI